MRINYDSEKEVNEYIKDLKTLHEVMDARYNAYYHEKQRLNDFKIFNSFIWFDTCGNTMVKLPKDNSYSEFDSYSPIYIPNEKDTCPFCGKGFSIYKLNDYFQNYESKFYHKQCNLFNKLDNQKREFEDVFSKVYKISDCYFKAIPNQYDSWEGYSPWFIVSTPDGDIEIGRRKRVISIEWLNDYKNFSDEFKNQDVTKQFGNERYIHAWGIENCIEYLKRAKNSIYR